MKYKFVVRPRFEKQFKKLDGYSQQMIKAWITKNIITCENPREKGKSLVGNHKGQWRYRIGDYRLICQIRDEELVILAINVGHRRDIYKK